MFAHTHIISSPVQYSYWVVYIYWIWRSLQAQHNVLIQGNVLHYFTTVSKNLSLQNIQSTVFSTAEAVSKRLISQNSEYIQVSWIYLHCIETDPKDKTGVNKINKAGVDKSSYWSANIMQVFQTIPFIRISKYFSVLMIQNTEKLLTL